MVYKVNDLIYLIIHIFMYKTFVIVLKCIVLYYRLLRHDQIVTFIFTSNFTCLPVLNANLKVETHRQS
jgi:hypothetical protein